MVIPKSDSSSSISSVSSVSSLDDSVKSGCGGSGGAGAVKFLCSYGGRILPRYPDGKLRYVGGDTRVLSVDRSVLFAELLAKIGELSRWGSRVSVRCQLPTEDLDALVTVRSDEDLANLIEEYDLANRERASPLKIRTFLFPLAPPQLASSKPSSPPLSAAGSPPKGKNHVFPPPSTPSFHRRLPGFPARVAAGGVLPCQHQHRQHHHHHHHHHAQQHHQHHVSSACAGHSGGGMPTATSAPSYRPPQQAYLVHSGNYWQ